MIIQEERSGKLTLLTVSDIGSNHRDFLLPNQDAAGCCVDGDDFVLAISDGVGSCPRAEIGSHSAVSACVRVFSEIKKVAITFEDASIVDAVIKEWRSSLDNGKIDNYCATLKAVFKVGQAIKAISIGDGFIGISSEGRNLKSPIEETAFTNETNCLSSNVSVCDFWVGSFCLEEDKSYAIVCCSDGVANGIIAGQEIDLVEEIEKRIGSQDLKAELVALLAEISEYCFDDKTIGVVKYEQ